MRCLPSAFLRVPSFIFFTAFNACLSIIRAPGRTRTCKKHQHYKCCVLPIELRGQMTPVGLEPYGSRIKNPLLYQLSYEVLLREGFLFFSQFSIYIIAKIFKIFKKRYYFSSSLSSFFLKNGNLKINANIIRAS